MCEMSVLPVPGVWGVNGAPGVIGLYPIGDGLLANAPDAGLASPPGLGVPTKPGLCAGNRSWLRIIFRQAI